jgi:hypothetical protein
MFYLLSIYHLLVIVMQWLRVLRLNLRAKAVDCQINPELDVLICSQAALLAGWPGLDGLCAIVWEAEWGMTPMGRLKYYAGTLIVSASLTAAGLA